MTTVPSNLVPTKITDLPVAPNPTSSATMVCVIGGVTYQVQFIDLQSTVSVPASRAIYTGGGLQGGGDFSADRTHSIATGGVTNDKLADNGVVAGTYGSGATIPVVTVDAKGLVTSVTEVALVISGYVPDTRQIIAGAGLTGGGNLQADRTLAVDFSVTTPAALGAVSAGVSDQLSRGDHVHPALNLASVTELTGVLPITNGGTGTSITNLTAGAIWYTDGSNPFLESAQGLAGQVLLSGGTSFPTWGSALVISDQPANYVYAGPTSGVDAPTSFRLLVDADIPATLTGKTLSGSLNTFSNIDNSSLTYSSVTINGTVVSLGGSGTITASLPNSLTIGTGLSGTSFNGSTAVTIAIDSTVTTLTGSQTLSNKTLTSPTINTPILSGGSINNAIIGASVPAAATFTSATLTSGTIATAPTNGLDIVNKDYADSIASGLNYHTPVIYASTTALPAYNYNNGAAGVGATITATANGALSIGGGSPTTTQRVLVKDEVGGNAAYNGVYTVTATGSPTAVFQLTRATDYDTSGTGANQIDAGDYVLVISGTNASTAWVQQTALPIIVGTTALAFLQFNAPIVYSAGTGLNLSPATTFNISATGVVATTYGSASSVPVFTVNAQGQLTSVTNTNIAIANTAVSGLGTMSTQAASSVAITGGAIDGTTVGATTANTGAFTTLSAANTVSGAGFSAYLASPPAIGGTVAAAGSFTTLGASGTATLNTLSSSGATITGGTIDGTTIGATTATTGKFTTVTATTGIFGGTF